MARFSWMRATAAGNAKLAEDIRDALAPVKGAAQGFGDSAVVLTSTLVPIGKLKQRGREIEEAAHRRGDTATINAWRGGKGGVIVLETIYGSRLVKGLGAAFSGTAQATEVTVAAETAIATSKNYERAVRGAQVTIRAGQGTMAYLSGDYAYRSGVASYYAGQNGDVVDAEEHFWNSVRGSVSFGTLAKPELDAAGQAFLRRYATQPPTGRVSSDISIRRRLKPPRGRIPEQWRDTFRFSKSMTLPYWLRMQMFQKT